MLFPFDFSDVYNAVVGTTANECYISHYLRNGLCGHCTEHPLKVNKSASALLGAGLLWTVYAVQGNSDVVGEELSESLGQIAQIIFFLMGAMTIVEVIDAHNGFALVTSRIRTTKLTRLLWIVGS